MHATLTVSEYSMAYATVWEYRSQASFRNRGKGVHLETRKEEAKMAVKFSAVVKAGIESASNVLRYSPSLH